MFGGVERKEAVFSSSEDRIRARHGSFAVAGPSIVRHKTSLQSALPELTVVNSRDANSNPGFSTTNNWIARAAEGLFTVLFPGDCRICDGPLLNISRLPVCPDCLERIHPVDDKVCSICGERVLSVYAENDADGLRRCPVCRRIERPFTRAVAYGSYDGGLRELIHLLKYSSVRPAAHVLGRMLAESIAALEPEFEQATLKAARLEVDEIEAAKLEADKIASEKIASAKVAVIPVPLYKGRRRQRGFNQAELIARAALRFLPQERMQLVNDVLLRTRDTHSQIGLTSHQRRENMRGAFAVSPTRAKEVIGRSVLLVDDVYTTGTTLTECARMMRRAGASQVWVATAARTLKNLSFSVVRLENYTGNLASA